MDLTSGNADGVQTMVDTVEVVSTGEHVLEQHEETPNVNINVVSGHSGVSIPSSGVSFSLKFKFGATPIFVSYEIAFTLLLQI